MIRVVVNPKTHDRWPVEFRNDCERTYPDDEGLYDLRERAYKNSYEVISLQEARRRYDSNGNPRKGAPK